MISPHEQLQLSAPRGFADQTVRRVLHMAGGGEAFRVRLTNRYGRTPLAIAAARVAVGHRQAALAVGGAEQYVVAVGEEAEGGEVDRLTVLVHTPDGTTSYRPSKLP